MYAISDQIIHSFARSCAIHLRALLATRSMTMHIKIGLERGVHAPQIKKRHWAGLKKRHWAGRIAYLGFGQGLPLIRIEYDI